MGKWDLADACNFMKGIILPVVHDDIIIAEPFRHGIPNDELIAGINAFHDFLIELFDRLAAEKKRFDLKKATLYDPENGEESLWKCFPVTKDLAALLFFIGLHGKLETEPNVELMVYGTDLLKVPKYKSEKFYGLRKLSGKRLSELFEFLSEMSFFFEDINYTNKVDLAKTGVFYISYENDRNLLIGLKLLAEAQANIKSEHYRLDSAFMRCDYSPLTEIEPIEHQIKLIDCVDTQPPDIKKWLVELNEFLLSNGCSVTGEKNGDITISYISRKSRRWICKLYFGVIGYRIRPNINCMCHTGSVSLEFPETMLSVIRAKCCTNCYGDQLCTHGGAFKFTQNGENFAGCRSPHNKGYKFTLDNVEDRQVIKKWIEQELQSRN